MAHNGDIDTESFYDDNQNIDDATSDDKKVFFFKKRYDIVSFDINIII